MVDACSKVSGMEFKNLTTVLLPLEPLHRIEQSWNVDDQLEVIVATKQQD